MAFATPSLTLNRYRFGPLRSSQLALVTLIQMNKRPAPYNLRFTFKEQTERRNRPRGFPSHEIHSLTPLHRIRSIEFTPRTRKTSSFGPTPTRRQILFHSRFLTTSMVYSSINAASLLRPASDPGVRLVSRVPFPHCKVRHKR